MVLIDEAILTYLFACALQRWLQEVATGVAVARARAAVRLSADRRYVLDGDAIHACECSATSSAKPTMQANLAQKKKISRRAVT